MPKAPVQPVAAMTLPEVRRRIDAGSLTHAMAQELLEVVNQRLAAVDRLVGEDAPDVPTLQELQRDLTVQAMSTEAVEQQLRDNGALDISKLTFEQLNSLEPNVLASIIDEDPRRGALRDRATAVLAAAEENPRITVTNNSLLALFAGRAEMQKLSKGGFIRLMGTWHVNSQSHTLSPEQQEYLRERITEMLNGGNLSSDEARVIRDLCPQNQVALRQRLENQTYTAETINTQFDAGTLTADDLTFEQLNGLTVERVRIVADAVAPGVVNALTRDIRERASAVAQANPDAAINPSSVMALCATPNQIAQLGQAGLDQLIDTWSENDIQYSEEQIAALVASHRNHHGGRQNAQLQQFLQGREIPNPVADPITEAQINALSQEELQSLRSLWEHPSIARTDVQGQQRGQAEAGRVDEAAQARQEAEQAFVQAGQQYGAGVESAEEISDATARALIDARAALAALQPEQPAAAAAGEDEAEAEAPLPPQQQAAVAYEAYLQTQLDNVDEAEEPEQHADLTERLAIATATRVLAEREARYITVVEDLDSNESNPEREELEDRNRALNPAVPANHGKVFTAAQRQQFQDNVSRLSRLNRERNELRRDLPDARARFEEARANLTAARTTHQENLAERTARQQAAEAAQAEAIRGVFAFIEEELPPAADDQAVINAFRRIDPENLTQTQKDNFVSVVSLRFDVLKDELTQAQKEYLVEKGYLNPAEARQLSLPEGSAQFEALRVQQIDVAEVALQEDDYQHLSVPQWSELTADSLQTQSAIDLIPNLDQVRLTSLMENNHLFPAVDHPETEEVRTAVIGRLGELTRSGQLTIHMAQFLSSNEDLAYHLDNFAGPGGKDIFDRLEVQKLDTAGVQRMLATRGERGDPRFLSCMQLRQLTVEDYRNACEVKRNFLRERIAQLQELDAKLGMIDGGQPLSLPALFVADKLKNLSDADLGIVMQTWLDDRTPLKVEQQKALVERLQSYQGAAGASIGALARQSGIQEVKDALNEFARPVADLIANPQQEIGQEIDGKCALTAGQFKGILQVVSTDRAVKQAVAALDFDKLTDAQKEVLLENDQDVVKAINYLASSRGLSPAMAAHLLKNPGVTNPGLRQYLTVQSQAVATIKDSHLNAFDGNGVSFLTLNQCQTLPAATVAKLSPTVLQNMVAHHLVGLARNAEAANALSIEQLTALTKNPNLFGPAQSAAPEVKPLRQALRNRYQRLLRGGDLMPEQLGQVNQAFLDSFPAEQQAEITAYHHMQAMDIDALTAALKQTPPPAAFDVSKLSDHQIAQMTIKDHFNAANAGHRAALLDRARAYNHKHQASFAFNKDSLTTLVLTAPQIQGLTDEQLVETMQVWKDASVPVSADSAQGLSQRLATYGGQRTPQFLQLVSDISQQVANPPEKERLAAYSKPAAQLDYAAVQSPMLSDPQFRAVVELIAKGRASDEQVAAVATMNPTTLSPDKTAILTSPDGVEAVKAMAASRRLTPAMAHHLAQQLGPSKARSIPHLTVQAIEPQHLSTAQINETDAAPLTAEQQQKGQKQPVGVSVLTAEQLRSLDAGQIDQLKPEIIATMTPAQMAGLAWNENVFAAPAAGKDPFKQQKSARDAFLERLKQLIEDGSISIHDAAKIRGDVGTNPSHGMQAASSALRRRLITQAYSIRANHLQPDPLGHEHDTSPADFSRDQLNRLTVADYQAADASFQPALLRQAKQLADNAPDDFNLRPDSLLALYLKPDAIRKLDKEQLIGVSHAWLSAKTYDLPFEPTQEQRQALLDRHRSLHLHNDAAAQNALVQTLNSFPAADEDDAIEDNITAKQIMGLESGRTCEVAELWASDNVKCSDAQLAALIVRVRDSNTGPAQASTLQALKAKTDDRNLKANLDVLTLSADRLTAGHVAAVGPDGNSILSTHQIFDLLSDSNIDTALVQALNPQAMTPEQRHEFIHSVNIASLHGSDLLNKLSEQQVRFLVRSGRLSPDVAEELEKRSDLDRDLRDDLYDQSRATDFTIGPKLTVEQLQDHCNTNQLQQLKPADIARMDADQVIGLLRNGGMKADLREADVSKRQLTEQRKTGLKRAAQLARMGVLTRRQAAELRASIADGEDDSLRYELLTQSKSTTEIQAYLSQPAAQVPPEFKPGDLSRAQMQRVDWTNVHKDHKDDLVKRAKALRQPAVLADSAMPLEDPNRVLQDDGKQLNRNSHFLARLLDAGVQQTGKRFATVQEFADYKDEDGNQPYKHAIEQLMHGPQAVQVARVCEQAAAACDGDQDEKERVYADTLRQIIADPIKEADFAELLDVRDLADFRDADPVRRGLNDAALKQEAHALLKKHFPKMLQREFLAIKDKTALVQTVDLLERSGMTPEDLSYKDGKDKKLINLPALIRAYKLNDKGELESRDEDEGHNFSAQDIAKESASVLSAVKSDGKLKNDVVNKAKKLSAQENFTMEDQLFQEQCKAHKKKRDEELKKLERELERMRNQLKQKQKQSKAPNFDVSTIAGDLNNGWDAWLRALLQWLQGMGRFYESAKDEVRQARAIVGLTKVQEKLKKDYDKLSPIDREHLRKIAAYHRARHGGHQDKASEAYRDLEKFYAENKGKIREGERHKLWEVDGKNYGVKVPASFKRGFGELMGKAKETMANMTKDGRAAAAQAKQKKIAGQSSRAVNFANKSLKSICRALEMSPRHLVKEGRREVYLNTMLDAAINRPGATASDVLKVLKLAKKGLVADKTDVIRAKINEVFTRLRLVHGDTPLSDIVSDRERADLGQQLMGQLPTPGRSVANLCGFLQEHREHRVNVGRSPMSLNRLLRNELLNPEGTVRDVLETLNIAKDNLVAHPEQREARAKIVRTIQELESMSSPDTPLSDILSLQDRNALGQGLEPVPGPGHSATIEGVDDRTTVRGVRVGGPGSGV